MIRFIGATFCLCLLGVSLGRNVIRSGIILHTLLFCASEVLCLRSSQFLSQTPPTFSVEPPALVTWLESIGGARVSCAARGIPQPSISWVTSDGDPVRPIPGIRHILPDGTLVLRGKQYLPQNGYFGRVDSTVSTFRCKASNEAGTIVSREVRIEYVDRPQLLTQTRQLGPAVPGCSVAMECVSLTTGFPRSLRHGIAWYRDGRPLHMASAFESNFQRITTSGGSYLILLRVMREDSAASFSCALGDSLTTDLGRPAYLNIAESSLDFAPRLTHREFSERTAWEGDDVSLVCYVQGQPPPEFSWYRMQNGQRVDVTNTPRVITELNMLKLQNVRLTDTGVWMCKVSNRFGDLIVEVDLKVKIHLQATVEPRTIVAITGTSARMDCGIKGESTGNVQWFRNGEQLNVNDHANRLHSQGDRVIVIRHVVDADAGLYQCAVTNIEESTQAVAQLVIGDTAPQLLHTFSEEVLRADDHVSLICSARAEPKPKIAWTLDGKLVSSLLSQRYHFEQHTDNEGLVISRLNITGLQGEDGGLYGCNASNTVGVAVYQARLNVYGPPNIRFIQPIHVVAGTEVEIYCPYYGYPISSVKWEKKLKPSTETRKLTNSLKFNIASKPGIFYIQEVTVEDSGTHVCTVIGPSGELARREMQLIVHKPPKLVPFIFPTDMEEGGNIQAGCSVASGDQPIYFTWYKDGKAIPDSLKVELKNINFFSLLIITNVTAEHNGFYTCKAVNNAAATNFTAELIVKVPPQWTLEPKNVSTIAGSSLVVPCGAKGHPTPLIKWTKDLFISIVNTDLSVASDHEMIAMDDGSLWFSSVKNKNKGWYQCSADNNVGKVLTKAIFVSVNEPPIIKTTTRNVTTRRGTTAFLHCEASGDKPLSLDWFRGSQNLIYYDKRFSLSAKPSEEGTLSLNVSIKNTKSQDSGAYKCLSENPFGKSEVIVNISILDRPDTPANVQVLEVSSRSVRLSWMRSSDGGSPILYYVLQYQVAKGLYGDSAATRTWLDKFTTNVTIQVQKLIKDQSTNTENEQYFVNGLKPATSYIFRLLAVNSIDSSAFTDTIVAKTREDVPSDSPRNLVVRANHPKELEVTWKVLPQDSWNGNLLGYMVYWKEDNPAINNHKDNRQQQSAQVSGSSASNFIISNLKQFTQYSVGVSAYNHVGSGPMSSLTSSTTLEGVPEAAPANITCATSSSISLRVWWQPLAQNLVGGVLLGYKVHYSPIPSNEYESEDNSAATGEVKRSDGPETTLRALQRFTKYSVSVRAYTAAGDGLLSSPVTCITDEDVPGPPADLKASPQSSTSLVVSWLPPQTANGIILHYTVFIRDVIRSSKATQIKIPRNSTEGTLRLDSNTVYLTEYQHTVRGLIEGAAYEIWMSVSTMVGEGPATNLLIKKPSSIVGAKILSFGGNIKVHHGMKAFVKCTVSGSPKPHTQWYKDSVALQNTNQFTVTPQGHLQISDIDVSSAGTYTCSAHNSGGSDRIAVTLTPLKPHPPPRLSLLSVHTKSLMVSLSGSLHRTTYLHYKALSQQGGWRTVNVPLGVKDYAITGLACGTVYQIYATTNNDHIAGDDVEKSLLTLKTAGGSPIPPKDISFLSANDTVVLIDTSAWFDKNDITEECGQIRIRVEVTARGERSWMFSPVVIAPNPIYLATLHPATWYRLKVSAANEVGMTVSFFNFATTTETGQLIAPPPDLDTYFNDSYSDTMPIVIIFAAVTLVGALFTAVILKIRSPVCDCSKTALDDCNDQNNSKESGKIPHGDIYSTAKKQSNADMYEISPYATFSGAPEPPDCGSPSRALPDYMFNLKTFAHDDELASQGTSNTRRLVHGRHRDKNEHIPRVSTRTPLRCCEQYDAETQLSYPKVEQGIRISNLRGRSPKSYQDSDTDEELHYQKLHSMMHNHGPRR